MAIKADLRLCKSTKISLTTIQHHLYQTIVGHLLNPAMSKLPEILSAVGVQAQRLHAPS